MKRQFFLVLFVCLLFSWRASSQSNENGNSSPPENQPQENQLVIRTEVNLITFGVFVENRGKPITGLMPENFRVEVCKIENEDEICEFQEVAYADEVNRPPIRGKIIIDTSPSSERYLESVSKRSAPNLVKELGRPGDEFEFYEYVQTMFLLGSIKIDSSQTPDDIEEEVKRILNPVRPKSYGSHIFSSIYLAIKHPQYGFAKSNEENIFELIIIVTDGYDYSDDPLVESIRIIYEDDGYEETVTRLCPENRQYRTIGGCRGVRVKDIISALEEEEVVMYVVDTSKRTQPPLATFIPDNTPDNLEEITDATGGRRIQASNSREVDRTFEKIAETIKRTYVVGFYPSEGFTGRNRYVRRVEVGRIENDGEFKKYNYDIYTAERYVVR